MSPDIHFLVLSDPSSLKKMRRLAWREYGDAHNKRVIVCVHGLSRNSLDFDKIAQVLSTHYRVISVDVAGRGESDWLEDKNDYNYGVYLNDMHALFAHLQLNCVHWLGTSMGGIIGMMLGAQYPALIRRLILNDVGCVVSAEGLKRILGTADKKWMFDEKAAALAYLKTVITTFGIQSEEDWEYMFWASFKQTEEGKYCFRHDPDITRAFRESAMQDQGIQDVDLSMFWNAISCPVLLLRGMESDIITHEAASIMGKRPEVSVVEFEGVGHVPALLDSQQIETVTNWLDKTKEY